MMPARPQAVSWRKCMHPKPPKPNTRREALPHKAGTGLDPDVVVKPKPASQVSASFPLLRGLEGGAGSPGRWGCCRRRCHGRWQWSWCRRCRPEVLENTGQGNVPASPVEPSSLPPSVGRREHHVCPVSSQRCNAKEKLFHQKCLSPCAVPGVFCLACLLPSSECHEILLPPPSRDRVCLREER